MSKRLRISLFQQNKLLQMRRLETARIGVDVDEHVLQVASVGLRLGIGAWVEGRRLTWSLQTKRARWTACCVEVSCAEEGGTCRKSVFRRIRFSNAVSETHRT